MQPPLIDTPFDLFDVVKGAVWLLAFFLAASFTALAAFRRLNRTPEDLGVVAAISFVVGPILLAWLLAVALWLAPGRPARDYVALAALAAFPTGFYGAYRYFPGLVRIGVGYCRSLLSRPFLLALAMLLLAAVAVLLVEQLMIALIQPPFANDTLEYLTAGRLIADGATIRDYPYLDGAQTGGFIAPWTHPPSYVSLIAFAYWLQGSSEFAGAAKFISPYFMFAQAMLLLAFVDRGRKLAGPLAALLCAATPVYFLLNSQAHIDSLRIAAFTAAAVAVWLLARRMSVGSAVVAGFALGAAHMSHSIGFVTLGFLIPLFFLTANGPFPRQAGLAAMFAAIGVAIVAPFALKNISVFGSLIQDTGIVWTFEELAIDESLAIERGIYTLADKVFVGALKGFAQPEYYGLLYWGLAGAIVVAAARLGPSRAVSGALRPAFRQSALGSALILSAGFVAFLFLTIALGTDTAIKNIRYVLTPQPLVAVALAHLLSAPFEAEAAAGP